jgi:hypothetical protein
VAVPKRFRLANIAGVATELKRCYRAAWDGEISWQDAGCAARILRELRFCIESGEIERRIEALEAALADRQGQQPRRPNGGGAYHAARP